MSGKCDELKDKWFNAYPEIMGIEGDEPTQCYIKSEADKVISDLEESHKMEVEQLLMEIVKLKEIDSKNRSAYYKDLAMMAKDVEHHKFKRCLAMAKWCESKVYHIRRTPLCDMSEHEYWQYENDFWQKWEKCWLEIAEKFKEAK